MVLKCINGCKRVVEAIAIDDNNGGALGQIRDLVRTFEEEHGRQVRRVQTKQILDEGMKYYNEAHNGDDNDHKADNRKLAIERFTEALNLCQVGTLEPRYKKLKKDLTEKRLSWKHGVNVLSVFRCINGLPKPKCKSSVFSSDSFQGALGQKLVASGFAQSGFVLCIVCA